MQCKCVSHPPEADPAGDRPAARCHTTSVYLHMRSQGWRAQLTTGELISREEVLALPVVLTLTGGRHCSPALLRDFSGRTVARARIRTRVRTASFTAIFAACATRKINVRSGRAHLRLPSSYSFRWRRFARHARSIRVFSPRSAWQTTSRFPRRLTAAFRASDSNFTRGSSAAGAKPGRDNCCVELGGFAP